MHFTKPWFESAIRIRRSRRIEPKKWFYQELLPLASKNSVRSARPKPAGSACTEELNAFFACLRKWEFDDLRCSKDHNLYMKCVEVEKKKYEDYRANLESDGSKVSSSGGEVSLSKLNKLMRQWPQPDLGLPPYMKMQRLPNMSYSDDIYRRQKIATKKS